jgi:hypothetical protein
MHTDTHAETQTSTHTHMHPHTHTRVSLVGSSITEGARARVINTKHTWTYTNAARVSNTKHKYTNAHTYKNATVGGSITRRSANTRKPRQLAPPTPHDPKSRTQGGI